MELKTPLYEQHLAAGATMVPFAGWSMPIHYGSQLQEHHKVREDCGMFDVSHMAAIDVQGAQAKDFLRYVLANDVNKLMQPGHALYSCMLNEAGGIIDDLIVYYLSADNYRIVVNAGTRDKDKAWLDKQAQQFKVQLTLREDVAIIAVQGPKAREKVQNIVHPHVRAVMANLKVFDVASCDDMLVARTGYTGEDGYEIMLPASKAAQFWQACVQADIAPCGLGARDTLRLEAGLNLYGSDMDESTTPLESNLAWTVAFTADREFIGQAALLAQKQQGIAKRLVGLILEDKGVLRSHQKIIAPNIGEGETTSGTFSPTLGRSIALARVPAAATEHCLVEIRGKQLSARIVKPPFVRYGKKIFE